jgi:DNA invertase Pin-like site-specific DNA recombinase
VGFLSETHGAGVNLYLHQQAVDTTTPAGRALFQMMGVFAEFERAMIRDRVKAGLANAKAKGVKLGAPRTDAKVIRRIERQAKGLSGHRYHAGGRGWHGASRVERRAYLTGGRGVTVGDGPAVSQILTLADTRQRH